MDTCYCCDNESSGRDHVPPKCLFPSEDKGVSNLITVPSCAAHNNKQSKADEYLRFILASSTSNQSEEVSQTTIRGIVRLLEMGSKSLEQFGIDRTGEEVALDGDAPVDNELLNSCLEKIARGIYHHHHNLKKKLRGKLLVCTAFLGGDPAYDPENYERLTKLAIMAHQDLNQRPILGEHPNTFGYQIIEDIQLVTVNMVFYGDRVVSVMSLPTGA